MKYKNHFTIIKEMNTHHISIEDRDLYNVNGSKPFDPMDHAIDNQLNIRKISETPTGHHIYHINDTNHPEYHTIYAWHPDDKTSHVSVNVTDMDKNKGKLPKNIHVDMVSSKKGSSLKAHDLYHHLITNHDMVITSGEQTMGGLKLWKNLAKNKDVSIRGFIPSNNEFTGPVNLDTMEPLNPAKSNMLLIASKSNNE